MMRSALFDVDLRARMHCRLVSAIGLRLNAFSAHIAAGLGPVESAWRMRKNGAAIGPYSQDQVGGAQPPRLSAPTFSRQGWNLVAFWNKPALLLIAAEPGG
jgi:hypothetical protein